MARDRERSVAQQAGETSEVSSHSDGACPIGMLDMAGDVWKWMAHWYDEDYYSGSPPG